MHLIKQSRKFLQGTCIPSFCRVFTAKRMLKVFKHSRSQVLQLFAFLLKNQLGQCDRNKFKKYLPNHLFDQHLKKEC